jgi:hypothetical protein
MRYLVHIRVKIDQYLAGELMFPSSLCGQRDDGSTLRFLEYPQRIYLKLRPRGIRYSIDIHDKLGVYV